MGGTATSPGAGPEMVPVPSIQAADGKGRDANHPATRDGQAFRSCPILPEKLRDHKKADHGQNGNHSTRKPVSAAIWSHELELKRW